MEKKLFLGIDGGGTKTAAVVSDENGRIAARAAGGTINQVSAGLPAARRNLAALLNELSQRTGTAEYFSVFIGSAAYSGPVSRDEAALLCGGIVYAPYLCADSDLFAALEGMNTPGAAAVAVCGTGSMAAGRPDENAPVSTAGGWGYRFGDEGSAFSVARDAVRAVFRAADGVLPETALSGKLCAFFGAKDARDLLNAVYASDLTPGDFAKAAPVVFACAFDGDKTAKAIVQKNLDGFCETVQALLSGLPPAAPLGLWGGLFQNVPAYREAFAAKFREHSPALLPYPPETGALFAAFKSAGLAVPRLSL